MKIVLYAAVGLAVGLGAGTGVSALKHKKVLTAELMTRLDSIATVQADSLAAAEHEAEALGHSAPDAEQPAADPDSTLVEGGHPEIQAEPGIVGDTAHTEDLSPDSMAAIESQGVPPSGEGEVEGVVAPVTPPSTGGPPSPADSLAEEGAMRLAKIFGAMDPDEAAKVLENLKDAEVQSILDHVTDRKVAAILSNFEPVRAASLSRVVMGLAPSGDTSGGGQGGDLPSASGTETSNAGSGDGAAVGSRGDAGGVG